MNVVILTGHLGKDPELKTLDGGLIVCNTTIATNKKTKNSEKTNWTNLVCFNKTAEFAQKWLKKGTKVIVTGELSNETVEGQDGTKKYFSKVIVNNFEFAVAKQDGDAPKEELKNDYNPGYASTKGGDYKQDDIPF